MSFPDHFSGHAMDYQRFRPVYPSGLFPALAQLPRCNKRVWDCGTGNGQGAHGLAAYFDEVIATDASEQQITAANPSAKVSFRVAPAEASGLEPGTVDLITVFQAVHWFEHLKFWQEVDRVAAPGAAVALISYGLTTVNEAVDRAMLTLYRGLLDPYWPPQRDHIDAGYTTIPFPFQNLPLSAPPMTATWTCDQFLGYLNTWSAVRRFRTDNEDHSALEACFSAMRAGYPEQAATVRWPLILKAGRVKA